jgi:hydrogenase nickel incorporation protein HypA/HybF
MHELELARRVIELASEAVAGRNSGAIATVHLRIGELAGVDPEALAFAFDAIKAETALGAAHLEFEPVPVLWECTACGARRNTGCAEVQCPDCGAGCFTLASGAELELAAVTLGDPATGRGDHHGNP